MILRLPAPSAHALQLSRALTGRLRARIAAAGGWIGFEEYMKRVLYEPGLGYYSAGSVKLGAAGDFVTAPELGGGFASVLAGELARLLVPLARPVIVELGAGSGALARDVMERLLELGRAPAGYWIVETSADLKARQRRALARYADRLRWLDGPPGEPFEGVVLANEVIDALPCSCFIKEGGRVLPLGVTWRDGALAWKTGAPEARLAQAVGALENLLERELEDGYRSEIRLDLPAWIEAVGAPLRRGSLLFCDYGLVRREYYHPERSGGTLMCHYRHRAHTDPFIFPGLQDLGAWVDFSACADAGRAAGFTVSGFTTQSQFLIESGIEPFPGERAPDRASLRWAHTLKTLVLPGEMGERFKLLRLTRNVECDPLPGRDFRDRL